MTPTIEKVDIDTLAPAELALLRRQQACPHGDEDFQGVAMDPDTGEHMVVTKCRLCGVGLVGKMTPTYYGLIYGGYHA